MSDPKLLPCPFCGGEAEFERTGTNLRSCIVACENCGGRHESSDVDERSGTSWNRRASLADTKERPIFTVDLDSPVLLEFVAFWNQMIVSDWAEKGYTHGKPPVVSVMQVAKVPGRLRILFGTGAAGFIDRETGDIYYSATYSRPAPHVRGNLFSALRGREAIGSAYGLRMLRA